MCADDCKFDGTITVGDFGFAARVLCERWKEECHHLPSWTWIPSSISDMEGYLSTETFYSSQQKEGSTNGDDDDNKHEEVNVADDDEATLVMEGSRLTHSYEFHIIYSFTYKVPVLYFRGYKCDGQLLELKLIESDLPLYSSESLRESKWTFISQEEHPFLHRPWYMLHPCGTSEWMKLLLSSCGSSCQTGMGTRDFILKHYLLSWLSFVGQAVGLKVPLKLAACENPSSRVS